jgi:integrase
MAYTIERPPDKRGRVRHTGLYKDIRGRWRSAGTYATEKQAMKEAERAELEIESGRIADPKLGKQTFEKYLRDTWMPNHIMEHSTRQNYSYLIERYIIPAFGAMQIAQILPGVVRGWVVDLQRSGANPPTIRQCKVILDAIFTTALNDQITFVHAGKGVKTPTVARKPRRIITSEQFDAIYQALPDDSMRLLVETDIESGLRWGELTELRVRDLDFGSGVLTVSRVVVKLNPKYHPEGKRFFIKDYPKDKEWRQLRLASHLVAKIEDFVAEHELKPDDLLFEYVAPVGPRSRRVSDQLPDPETLGWTEPNAKGRTYRHGTPTAYGAGKCRCEHCRNSVAAYRAARRAAGKDSPRRVRVVDSDGHISGDWFRKSVWDKAVRDAGLGFHVVPHALRHAHASWLLAGGADIQVVKERLGHGSITTTARYLGTLPGADSSALQALDVIRGSRGGVAPSPADAPESGSVKDQKIRELEAKLAKFKALLDS